MSSSRFTRTLIGCSIASCMLVAALCASAAGEVEVDEAAAAAERQIRNQGRFPADGAWEVTITPPAVPGSEPSETPLGVERTEPFDGSGPDAGNGGPGVDEDRAGTSVGGAASPRAAGAGSNATGANSAQTGGADAAQPRASQPPGASGPAATASGPRMGFQVGAYRNKQHAEALQNKLSASFDDVYMTTINSGGEPLYRVRVGKLGDSESAAKLGARLRAAGYAAFPVSEPASR